MGQASVSFNVEYTREIQRGTFDEITRGDIKKF